MFYFQSQERCPFCGETGNKSEIIKVYPGIVIIQSFPCVKRKVLTEYSLYFLIEDTVTDSISFCLLNNEEEISLRNCLIDGLREYLLNYKGENLIPERNVRDELTRIANKFLRVIQ